jgi:hypothetical protein
VQQVLQQALVQFNLKQSKENDSSFVAAAQIGSTWPEKLFVLSASISKKENQAEK